MISKSKCDEHNEAEWNDELFRCEIDGKEAKEMAGVLGKKMPPTQDHRPALWENMLGTVKAMNKDREVKYFDYDWEDAVDFSELESGSDVRIAKRKRDVSYSNRLEDEPPSDRSIVWVRD